MSTDQKNTATIVTRQQESFISMLPSIDVTTVEKGKMIIYSPIDTPVYMPLLIRKKDTKLYVTPQENIPENPTKELFSDTPLLPCVTYVFEENELINLLWGEPDYLCSVIAFMEKHLSLKEFKSDDFIGMLQALLSNGYGISTIMLSLESLNKHDLIELCTAYKEMPDTIHYKFYQNFVSKRPYE